MGANALAGRRANAVGAVRITLTPDGIEIELLRVAGFALGFALGGVAEPVSLRAPYTAVRALVREGHVLYLALDPAVVTPCNRFALAGFTEDPTTAAASASHARTGARLLAASRLLPAPLGVLAAAIAPAEYVAGALGRASLGVLAALLTFAALSRIAAWQTLGGPQSDRLRDLFEAELAERLALTPTPRRPSRRDRAHPPPRRPPPARPRSPEPLFPPRPPRRGAPARRFPSRPPAASPGPSPRRRRPRRGSCIVGVMLFLQRFAAPRPPTPAVDPLLPGLAAAARAVRLDVRAPAEPEPCVCNRADSPLWKDGIPHLAVLAFHGDDELARDLTPTLDRGGHPQYDFDLAVVNDSARPLHDVRVTLTFARRDRSGRRVGAVDRGLFWGGVLAPGGAVKWRVSPPLEPRCASTAASPAPSPPRTSPPPRPTPSPTSSRPASAPSAPTGPSCSRTSAIRAPTPPPAPPRELRALPAKEDAQPPRPHPPRGRARASRATSIAPRTRRAWRRASSTPRPGRAAGSSCRRSRRRERRARGASPSRSRCPCTRGGASRSRSPTMLGDEVTVVDRGAAD